MDTKRIALLDSLRGFSLFGILMANLLIFQYGIWRKEELAIDACSKLDRASIYLSWAYCYFAFSIFEA